jgi:hypothetical protein
MSFRIGRTRAQHTYPEARSNQGPLPFAEVSAEGPDGDLDILATPGTLIVWGTPAGTDVPITPKVSGKVTVVVMLGFKNTDTGASHTVTVTGEEGAGVMPNQTTAPVTIPASGAVQIPFVYTIGGAGNAPLPLGVATILRIRAVASVGGDQNVPVKCVSESCFFDAQEHN